MEILGGRVRGMGRAFGTSARLLAAPLALCLAVMLLPSGTRTALAASRTALGRRMGTAAGSADGAAVDSSLAAVFSNPALGRTLRALRHQRGLTGFERALLDAAVTASRSSSVLAGRLLGTQPTPVDRARLAALGRALRANAAVSRLVSAGSTLARQRWPLETTLERYRTALATAAAAPRGAGDRAVATFGDVARTDAFRSLAASLGRVLSDAGAASYVASLPPLAVGGLLGRDHLITLRLDGDHPPATGSVDHAGAGAGIGTAAAVVVLAVAIVGGPPSPVVTAAAITLAT